MPIQSVMVRLETARDVLPYGEYAAALAACLAEPTTYTCAEAIASPAPEPCYCATCDNARLLAESKRGLPRLL